MATNNMAMKRPLILVCNDDGITAPGIRFLIDCVKELGDVVVVAPDKAQSGMGHAITIGDVVRMDLVSEEQGIKEYKCSGTPVDCIKLAISNVLDRTPDLLVSGMNHGANNSINVIYSGTMSAAVEGAMEGMKSIGFSYCNFAYDIDYSPFKTYVQQICKLALENNFPKHTCLNVNIPDIKAEDVKGIKVCRQAEAYWSDSFEKREDPSGRPYFWLKGNFENRDKGQDTDVWALKNNYISVVPTQYDLTAHHAISDINNWGFES